jgi:disulfide bond formation protein DsbB
MLQAAMSTETVNLFLAILVIGGLVAVGAGLFALFRSARSERAASMRRAAQPIALPLAFLAAAGAMAGSLYYSEVAGFDPCQLCWVQRFLMYPSAFVLAAALLRPRLGWFAVALAAPGLAVSLYHRLEQQFPASIGGSCDVENPCSGRWVETFGFITIPTMAAVAFALVIVFVPIALRPTVSRSTTPFAAKKDSTHGNI